MLHFEIDLNLTLIFNIFFQYNDKPILWTQLVRLVEESNPAMMQKAPAALGTLTPIPKLTPQHIYLTPSLRMRVKLAAQVLPVNYPQ